MQVNIYACRHYHMRASCSLMLRRPRAEPADEQPDEPADEPVDTEAAEGAEAAESAEAAEGATVEPGAPGASCVSVSHASPLCKTERLHRPYIKLYIDCSS